MKKFLNVLWDICDKLDGDWEGLEGILLDDG